MEVRSQKPEEKIKKMKRLNELPNIGKILERKLIEADIKTPQELRELGAEQTLLRLSIEDKTRCYNMLCALEGAIQGIRWHALPQARKEELKEFLRLKLT